LELLDCDSLISTINVETSAAATELRTKAINRVSPRIPVSNGIISSINKYYDNYRNIEL
jgi:hypothetical protein